MRRIFITMSGIFLSLLAATSLQAAVALHYASPLGEENWHTKGSRLRCGLALTIPDYGVAYFEKYATKDMRFMFRTWMPTQEEIRASIHAQNPSFKNQARQFIIARVQFSPGKYGFYMKREPTLKTLNYLSRGYEAVFNYRSEQGFPVSVTLSPVHFQEAYSQYIHCLANLLPYDFDSVENTVILYGTEDSAISKETKAQLARVAEYARIDRKVRRVTVIGYADDEGRKSYNNAISEKRAKVVQEYLLRVGMPKDLLYTTWKGASDPIAANDTETGRALNRRVVVQVEK